jgi:hypothetical protein
MKYSASEFHRNRQGNCAQAVVVAWHKKTLRNGELAEKLSGSGGGKAPEGLCGALYAINCLVDKESAAKLTIKFSKAAGGHTTCKAIRSSKSLSCTECVEVAAELLDEHLASLHGARE